MNFRDRLVALPPSICGIALGSVGLAGTLQLVASSYSLKRLNDAAIPLYVLSGLYVVIMATRVVLSPSKIQRELLDAPSISPYGALAMTLVFLFDRLTAVSVLVATIGVYASASLQVLFMALFFGAASRNKNLPEPFWFPTTVSVAIIGFSSDSIANMPRVLVEIAFWTGIVLMVALLPIATYRTLRYPHTVACNPTVGILQAPASFMTIAWFEIDGSSWLSLSANDILIQVLFGTSTLVFLLTLWATWVRRKYIIAGCSFTHAWASFTFPSISTTRAALLIAQRYSSATVLDVWASILALTLLPFVLVIILLYSFLVLVNPKSLLAEQIEVEPDLGELEETTQRKGQSCSFSN